MSKKTIVFTAEQIIAWSKEQEAFATPAWIKTKEGREAYKMAMHHLRVWVKHPIKEYI